MLKKILLILVLFPFFALQATTSLSFAREEKTCTFIAPVGWEYLDPSDISCHVKVFVKGKGQNEVPPSLNLALEKTRLSLKEYLVTAKTLHEASPYTTWCHLGEVKTNAGEAALTQIIRQTEWGEVRIMQTLLLDQGIIYILTATALKEEFTHYYQEFFRAMKSLTLHPNVLEKVGDKQKREHLKEACLQLKEEYLLRFAKKKGVHPQLPNETLASMAFQEEEFQKKQWHNFQKGVIEDGFPEMDKDWHHQIVQEMKEELLNTR